MKRAIAFLGLGLMMLAGCSDSGAAAGIAEAQSNGGADVSQRIYGHFFPNITNLDEGEINYSLSAMAKGRVGKATLSGWLVASAFPVPDGCPAGSVRVDLIRFEWGEIYDDGSLLHGVIDPGQFACYSPETLSYTVTGVTGIIDSGRGRFEGASGTWTVTATAGGGLTGTLKMYFN